MVKRKVEGISSLVRTPESMSIQDITMLDWFAGFALLLASPMTSPAESAKEAYDRAEAMLEERERRTW